MPDGEHISKIITRSNYWLVEIVFVTNKGSESRKFGGFDISKEDLEVEQV